MLKGTYVCRIQQNLTLEGQKTATRTNSPFPLDAIIKIPPFINYLSVAIKYFIQASRCYILNRKSNYLISFP